MTKAPSLSQLGVHSRTETRQQLAMSRSQRPRSLNVPVLLLVALHVPLALLMNTRPGVATFHALATITLGIILSLFGRNVQPIACVAGYVVGAEVLWRMTEADIFWEFGKYAVALLLAIGMFRFFKGWRRVALPILYGLMLTPSIFLTVDSLGMSKTTAEAISFNLSGPLALGVSALFFSQLQGSWDILRSVLWSVVIPITGIATVALYSSVSADSLVFTENSNLITSGGFGPNQVAAALGLGAVLCVFLAAWEKRRLYRWVAVALALWFIGHSMLTFSRGGVYSAAAALLLAAIHYLPRPRQQISFVATLLLVLFVSFYFIAPRLDEFTGGVLKERFTEIDTTRRDQIARADLAIWKENPLLGVGPGMSANYRDSIMIHGSAAHTEFTRLVAEHGTAGLLALLALMAMVVSTYRRASSLPVRGLLLAMAGWSLAEMAHSAMRIAAISFVFGLAMMNRLPRTSSLPSTPPEDPKGRAAERALVASTQ